METIKTIDYEEEMGQDYVDSRNERFRMLRMVLSLFRGESFIRFQSLQSLTAPIVNVPV